MKLSKKLPKTLQEHKKATRQSFPRATDPLSYLTSRFKEDPVTGCWLSVVKGKNRNGYSNSGGTRSASMLGESLPHRLALRSNVAWKSIPEGLEAAHLCDNRSCCNPSHIQAATRTENVTLEPARKNWHFQSLSSEQKVEIVTASANGEKHFDIAKRFSISMSRHLPTILRKGD